MRGADSSEEENVSSIWDGVCENAGLDDSKPLQTNLEVQFAQITDPAPPVSNALVN